MAESAIEPLADRRVVVAADVWHEHPLVTGEILCTDPGCPCQRGAVAGHRIMRGAFTLDLLADALARHRRQFPRR
jgi:hypothetical protein